MVIFHTYVSLLEGKRSQKTCVHHFAVHFPKIWRVPHVQIQDRHELLADAKGALVKARRWDFFGIRHHFFIMKEMWAGDREISWKNGDLVESYPDSCSFWPSAMPIVELGTFSIAVPTSSEAGTGSLRPVDETPSSPSPLIL